MSGVNPNRDYHRCDICSLIFVPAMFHLCPKEEKKIYDQHQNMPEDKNYRRFLNKLCAPLTAQLKDNASGLDFGSGPGPTLSLMFQELGYSCAIYDKFYACNDQNLKRSYDFVSSTEVIEHLSEPATTFELLFSMLKPHGCLGLMTKLIPEDRNFASWHYKNDPTHIAFYARETMRFIAERYNRALSIIGDDVIIFSPRQN